MSSGFDPEEEAKEAARIQKEKDDELQFTHDLDYVLSTPQGIRFIQKIIVEGGAFDDFFFGNSKDAFASGKRSFALRLWKRVYQDYPEKAVRMLQIDKPKETKQEEDPNV